MTVSLDLDQMSTTEKLRTLEAIWTSLSQTNPADVPAHQWHRDVLEAREQAVAEGRAGFSAWPEAKQRIRDRAR